MKTLLKISVVLLVLGGAGYASYKPIVGYWKHRNRPVWREVEVTRGRIVSVVNSTGEVKPVLSIQVGSFVSGPIDKINVDFNDEVKKGDVLAMIDPRLFDAEVSRDEAILATARAEVLRAEALLQQAQNDEKRAMALRAENPLYMSDTELDQYKFTRASREAALEVARASVQQAMASLERSKQNQEYTVIKAPDDGTIIERKIDRGQTLTAQFQTPEMFILAPRMREKMHVFASVDEADIGFVKQAQETKQPVQFTVDAYPNELFQGEIEQIRMSSTAIQNVVTYPVVVAAANPDLKLLPGMTASISFQIEEKEDVIKISNAALRFYPPDPQYVRPDDRKLLEGAAMSSEDEDENDELESSMMSASQRAEARAKRNRRHVWLVDGEYLRAVEVVMGISDNRYTELVSGDVQEGQKLVTGLKPKKG